MNPTMLIGEGTSLPVPLSQDVESSEREGKTGSQVGPDTMSHVLEVTYCMQHRKYSFHHRAHVPRVWLTHLHVGRISASQMEAMISQHYHLIFELSYHGVESGIVNVSAVVVPCGYQAPLVQHQPQLGTYYPASITQTFSANLLGRSAFSHWVEQFNPVSISHSQDGRFGHEAVCPLMMSSKQPKQASTLRQ